MKPIFFIPGIVPTLFFINTGQANAFQTRAVYSQDVKSGVELKIWAGYGLTINFIPSGEIIKQVWIGDPSRIVLSSNGNLCQKTDSTQTERSECTGATVLFLRQIKQIDFPNLLSSVDGSTQMTVITSSASGDKQYQFKLTPTTGIPSYTSLIIKPDSEKPKPLIISAITPETPTQEITFSNNTTVKAIGTKAKALKTSVSPKKNDGNILALGLALAVRTSQLQAYSINWYKAQTAILLLHRGKNRDDAVNFSGLDKKIFDKLIELGNEK